jgi:hypothetical protein
MQPDKLIIGFAIFSAVISFLPLVGVNQLEGQPATNVYWTENQSGEKEQYEIVNATTGTIRQFNLMDFVWSIMGGLFISGLLIGGLMKITGISFSGGVLISYAFFSIFLSLGFKALATILNVINTISIGHEVLLGVYSIFCLVFIYSIISYLRRIAAGAYE